MNEPIYTLAGQQDDPLREKVLALLYTDRPVTPAQRPGDTRAHWTWLARSDTENQGSRLWLSESEPITDGEVERMRVRAQAALEPLVPDRARSITVAAVQVAHDQVRLTVDVTTIRGESFSMTLGITRGDPSA